MLIVSPGNFQILGSLPKKIVSIFTRYNYIFYNLFYKLSLLSKVMKNLMRKLMLPLFFAVSLTSCAGYNTRISTIMIDKENKKDLQLGWGCLARGGNYTQIGILNLSLDNPWPTKLLPIYNSHTETNELKPNSTIQLGSIGYSEGSCFQLNYLNFRGNENPWYQKISPIIGWHKEVKENF